jgi:hypothetical protein
LKHRVSGVAAVAENVGLLFAFGPTGDIAGLFDMKEAARLLAR